MKPLTISYSTVPKSTSKCRDFLTQLGACMCNLRPCDSGIPHAADHARVSQYRKYYRPGFYRTFDWKIHVHVLVIGLKLRAILVNTGSPQVVLSLLIAKGWASSSQEWVMILDVIKEFNRQI